MNVDYQDVNVFEVDYIYIGSRPLKSIWPIRMLHRTIMRTIKQG